MVITLGFLFIETHSYAGIYSAFRQQEETVLVITDFQGKETFSVSQKKCHQVIQEIECGGKKLSSYSIDLLESSFWLLSTQNPTVQNLGVCYWFLFCVFELKLIIASLTTNCPQGSESECSLERKNTEMIELLMMCDQNNLENKQAF